MYFLDSNFIISWILLLTQGQYCDVCSSEDTNRAHPITNAIDGTERWWQSPPLSRSVKYNEVNVTLDLGQVCHLCILYLALSLSHTLMHVLYCVEITRRTVDRTSDTPGQMLLWIAHGCRISRVDPNLNLIHSYLSFFCCCGRFTYWQCLSWAAVE